MPKQGTSRLTQIVVGDDRYRRGDIESGELAEHVRAILGEPMESLHYRGVEYVRDPRYGDWLKLLPRDDRTTAFSHTISVEGDVPDPLTDLFSEEERKRLDRLLLAEVAQIETYERTDGEGGGPGSLVRVSGQSAKTIERQQLPDIEDLEKSAIIAPETRAELARFLSNVPNRFQQTVELSIDESSLLVHRLEWTLEGFRDDRIVHRFHSRRTFSLFNEAELPGPLPE